MSYTCATAATPLSVICPQQCSARSDNRGIPWTMLFTPRSVKCLHPNMCSVVSVVSLASTNTPASVSLSHEYRHSLLSDFIPERACTSASDIAWQLNMSNVRRLVSPCNHLMPCSVIWSTPLICNSVSARNLETARMVWSVRRLQPLRLSVVSPVRWAIAMTPSSDIPWHPSRTKLRMVMQFEKAWIPWSEIMWQ